MWKFMWAPNGRPEVVSALTHDSAWHPLPIRHLAVLR